jgi:hypothetical protein
MPLDPGRHIARDSPVIVSAESRSCAPLAWRALGTLVVLPAALLPFARGVAAQPPPSALTVSLGLQQSASRNPGASPYVYSGFGLDGAVRYGRWSERADWDVELRGARATLHSRISDGARPREVVTAAMLGARYLRRFRASERVEWRAGVESIGRARVALRDRLGGLRPQLRILRGEGRRLACRARAISRRPTQRDRATRSPGSSGRCSASCVTRMWICSCRQHASITVSTQRLPGHTSASRPSCRATSRRAEQPPAALCAMEQSPRRGLRAHRVVRRGRWGRRDR